MARLFGTWDAAWPTITDDDVLRAEIGTTAVRPGRCAGCSVAIVRPVGGPAWDALSCPRCGSGIMQSTFRSKAARGVLLVGRDEVSEMSAGRPIAIEGAAEHNWIGEPPGIVYCSRCGLVRSSGSRRSLCSGSA